MAVSRAYRVYLMSEIVYSLSFAMAFTAMAVYYIQTVGLNPLQLVLVGTVLELTCFLGEVPTGVVADTYSRRLSIVIGTVLIGVAFIFEGLLPIFAAVLLAQVVRGAGHTFISGAHAAWITDEIGEERAGKAFLRASQVSQFGSLAGIASSMVLGSLNLSVPIVLAGLIMLGLAAYMVARMPERGFKPTPRGDRTTFYHMSSTFRGGLQVIRGSSVLLTILAMELIFGAFSEGYDRLSDLHFIQNIGLPATFVPIVWFGLMSVAAMPLHLIVSEVVRRRLNTENHYAVARTLMVMQTLIIVSAVTFALAGNFVLAVVASLSMGLLRGLSAPIYLAWLNQNIESSVRATVLSMNSQVNALGQIAGGPVVGAIGNASIRLALGLGALLLTPTLWLFRRTLLLGPTRLKSTSVVEEPSVEVGL